jgi:hypothetical protein
MSSENVVKSLEKEVVPFIKKAESLVISSSSDMAKASETLSVINKYADTVKASKETVTKPLNVALKAARQLFAQLEDRLDGAIVSIRSAMITYQTEQKRIADAEAKKIADRIGEGKGKLKIETAVAKIEALDRPEEKIVVESGSVKFRTDKKFEIMDITMVPIEYHEIDLVKVRTAMKAGIELPGVRYYEEQIPINSR